MLAHRRVTPTIKFTGIHLYIWVKRGTLRVRCLAQQHNTISSVGARTYHARPRTGPPRKRAEAIRNHLAVRKFVVLQLVTLRGEKNFKLCPESRISESLRRTFQNSRRVSPGPNSLILFPPNRRTNIQHAGYELAGCLSGQKYDVQHVPNNSAARQHDYTTT